jgi:hypothetical protein
LIRSTKDTKGHEEGLQNKSLPFEPSRAAKVDQQRDSKLGPLQIIESLSFFLPGQAIQGFQLNDDLLVADEVRNILFLETMSFIENLERLLSFSGNGLRG